MIWFDIRQLERELVDGTLSEKQGFNYLLANAILFSAMPYLAGDHYQNHWLTSIQIVVDVFITGIIVRATFDINTRGDNKDYFKRFLSLSFVTTVRLFIYALIILIPPGVIMHFVERSVVVDKNVRDIFLLLLEIVMGIAFYFMLTSSFRRVNEKR
jgi:hypothetical protein